MSRDSTAGRARRRHHATRPEIQEANSHDEAQADAHGAEADRASPSEPGPDCRNRLLERAPGQVLPDHVYIFFRLKYRSRVTHS